MNPELQLKEAIKLIEAEKQLRGQLAIYQNIDDQVIDNWKTK